VLFATSTAYNSTPTRTPRPFDRDRDGLVCGEGCGIVVLEELDRARRRGARILAEVVGYHTSSSGVHISESSKDAMVVCMREALANAGLAPDAVDYVNAHATATIQGDQEEAAAVRELFGDRVPVSSLKGYIGHTLGASAALELIASLAMMARGTIYPTLNLETVAPDCAGIQHVTRRLDRPVSVLVKNSFGFGGIGAVLVCRKLPA
jgi:3-oxoacyl-[acyl-carrier-protein] synthase II